MKPTQILKALNIIENKYTKQHCSKLSDIYGVLLELTKSSFKAVILESECVINFGKSTEANYNWNKKEIRTLFEGVEMKAAKINFKTDKQDYTFTLPTDNAFFDVVCTLLQLEFKSKFEAETSKIKPLQTIEVSSEILTSIKKAAKFVSKDKYRIPMHCVLLHIKDNALKVVSTDAHRLYYSKIYSVDAPNELKVMLSPEAIKSVLAIKTKETTITIDILPAETTKGEYSEVNKFYALINGIKVELWQEERYPDYEAVIPKLETAMVFNRLEFVDKIKQVMPYSNKATNQVNFHLNGKIEMTCQDVDFGFEADREMAYASKNFEDTDIAFNGRFLVECLGAFKAKEVSMLSDGRPTRAALFTDGIETLLLMPLMLNGYEYKPKHIPIKEHQPIQEIAAIEAPQHPEIKPELSKVMYVCSNGNLKVKNGNFAKRLKRCYQLAA